MSHDMLDITAALAALQAVTEYILSISLLEIPVTVTDYNFEIF